MTQQQMEQPIHCYCGIYNVIWTSMTEKNPSRRFMLQTNKLEIEKASYQMKMKAWLVDASIYWVMLIVLGTRREKIKPLKTLKTCVLVRDVLRYFFVKLPNSHL
ncbi:hypothetical protein M9H77_36921 [Catharanthus roseus]|uniref:Uncharacterized protein n=1 Tax=Catharanthus roseus TaxID=4058 RepID=A0ACB9ZT62_CATRO|nr:hypothetical protein M9H77_36921 [Catharanthus roseus]